MTAFTNLSYVSASGIRAAVNHVSDDPYLGRPLSSLGIQLRNEGPVALEWMHQGTLVHRRFRTDVQAVVDPSSQRLIVIGHGRGDLDDAHTPDNGVVLLPSGRPDHRLHAPSHIESTHGPQSERIKPDGFSALEMVGGSIEIWISYWDGEWLERRAYDAIADRWGAVSANVRVR